MIEKTKPTASLITRIRAATTVKELKVLLHELESYDHVSDKTRRRACRIAKQCGLKLGGAR